MKFEKPKERHYGKEFDHFVFAMIALNTVILVFRPDPIWLINAEDPQSPNYSPGVARFFTASAYLFLTVYAIECFIKISAFGAGCIARA